MDDHGRLEELRRVAAGMGLHVDIVFARLPSSGASHGYFVVAEDGVLYGDPVKLLPGGET